MMNKPVRTRFAPSPTGLLHVGGIRTALFAWLYARQQNGQFILRFEDTDKAREKEGAREHLIQSLHSLGLLYDEGPDIGGPHAPYIQSERLDFYRSWAQRLIDSGRAYADPYSSEEVQTFRDQARAEKKPFLYRNHRPENPGPWDGSTPLRFKSDPKEYTWSDAVMGDISTGPEVIDDFILIKSDGYPTYNFCHIVDDAEMKITHIFRGQEFIASVPNYMNLYEALEIEAPVMAHMPHIMAEGGKRKLSKRDGAKDVLDYIREGYLPEALRSFIATLGWNDGTEQEVFTTDELIEKFSLGRIGKSGALFDERRLLWVDGSFIRELSIDELYNRSSTYLPESAAQYSDDYKRQVVGLAQERLKYFAELPALVNFFFEDIPINPELISAHKQLKKVDTSELKQLLTSTHELLANSDFSVNDLTTRLNELLETSGQKPAVLFSLIRIATTQAPASPGLADTMAVLGKETTLRRINAQIAAL